MIERGNVEPVRLVVQLVDFALTRSESGVKAELVDDAFAFVQLPHPDVRGRVAIQRVRDRLRAVADAWARFITTPGMTATPRPRKVSTARQNHDLRDQRYCSMEPFFDTEYMGTITAISVGMHDVAVDPGKAKPRLLRVS